MMSSANVEFCRLERPIDVYENERLWIGRGFSKAGLLPTERGPFSTQDGSASWKTMPAAALGLLRGDVPGKRAKSAQSAGRVRRGWSFHEEGTFGQVLFIGDANKAKEDQYECSAGDESGDSGPGNYCRFVPCVGHEELATDKDGWQYFPDFSNLSLLSPNRKRGVLDFVRRRKLSRVATFRPDHFLPREVYSKCDYCDSNVVDMLSSAMLDALALATLFASGPNNKTTEAQVLSLKSQLVDRLSIGNNCSNNTHSDEYDPSVDVNKARDRLRTFADTCVGKPGVMSASVSALLNPDSNVASALPERRQAVAKYLDEPERRSLARLVVKDVDRHSYQMHCRHESCACAMLGTHGDADDEGGDASACDFRVVPCLHPGCTAAFSHKHRTQHDDECGFKILPCPSLCGARVARKDMHIHVRDACPHREAECPLSSLGCTAIVQARDVASHLNSHADKHFMLVASRMMEYQSVIKDMNARIGKLEEKNGHLERELKRTTLQLENKSAGDIKNVTKRIGTLESTCRAEFKKMEYDKKNNRK